MLFMPEPIGQGSPSRFQEFDSRVYFTPVPANATIWRFGSYRLRCDHPSLLGVINVTPDSFSDGGRFLDPSQAVEQGLKLVADGADIIDIGGESTRPGSDPVSVEIELSRVIPVIEGLRESCCPTPISIDTRKLKVAEKAVESGAEIVNDVSALRDDPDLALFCAEKGLGVILMHMLGTPRTMQESPHYGDVIAEIGAFFEDRLGFATESGISHERIVFDPGIGFGKLLEHNLRILRECGSWLKLGRPILVGPSRKRFIGEILDVDVNNRLPGTIGACVAALASGARLFRVHDVAPVRQALLVAHSILSGLVPTPGHV